MLLLHITLSFHLSSSVFICLGLPYHPCYQIVQSISSHDVSWQRRLSFPEFCYCLSLLFSLFRDLFVWLLLKQENNFQNSVVVRKKQCPLPSRSKQKQTDIVLLPLEVKLLRQALFRTLIMFSAILWKQENLIMVQCLLQVRKTDTVQCPLQVRKTEMVQCPLQVRTTDMVQCSLQVRKTDMVHCHLELRKATVIHCPTEFARVF